MEYRAWWAEDLASEPPSKPVEPLVRADEDPEPLSLEEFFGRVAEKQGTGEELARKHVIAVFPVLSRTVDEGELYDVRSQLPKDFQSLLESS